MVSHQIDGLSALDVMFPEENSLNTKPFTMTPPNSNHCLEIQGGSFMAVISLQYSKAYCPFWDLVMAWSDDWFVALPFGVLGSFVLLWVYCTEQHTKVEVSWEGHMDLTSTRVPSIGSPLWLSCGWTSSELTLGVSLVTYLIKNRSCG